MKKSELAVIITASLFIIAVVTIAILETTFNDAKIIVY